MIEGPNQRLRKMVENHPKKVESQPKQLKNNQISWRPTWSKVWQRWADAEKASEVSISTIPGACKCFRIIVIIIEIVTLLAYSDNTDFPEICVFYILALWCKFSEISNPTQLFRETQQNIFPWRQFKYKIRWNDIAYENILWSVA